MCDLLHLHAGRSSDTPAESRLLGTLTHRRKQVETDTARDTFVGASQEVPARRDNIGVR